MEKSSAINDELIRLFIRKALPKIKQKLQPQVVLLFGSRVKGDSSKESDLDVLIVSDYFQSEPFLGRMPFMIRILHFPWPIDFLCYTSEEFEEIKDSSVIVQEALRKGVRLELNG